MANGVDAQRYNPEVPLEQNAYAKTNKLNELVDKLIKLRHTVTNAVSIYIVIHQTNRTKIVDPFFVKTKTENKIIMLPELNDVIFVVSFIKDLFELIHFRVRWDGRATETYTK